MTKFVPYYNFFFFFNESAHIGFNANKWKILQFPFGDYGLDI